MQWLTGNPILAFNLAMIGSTALAGAGMFLLVRELTGRADAAFIAGVAFACSPYRVPQAYHLQVLVSGWMPVALYALHRFLATRSTRALALFVLAFVLQAYSNGYFLYFLAIPVAVDSSCTACGAAGAASLSCCRGWLQRAVAILAALAPVAWAYVRVRREQGLARTPGDILQFSPDLSAYAHVGQSVWAWRHLLPIGRHEQELFPGLIVVLLAIGAAWYAPRAATASASSAGLPGSACHLHARLYLFILLLTTRVVPGPPASGVRLAPALPRAVRLVERGGPRDGRPAGAGTDGHGGSPRARRACGCRLRRSHGAAARPSPHGPRGRGGGRDRMRRVWRAAACRGVSDGGYDRGRASVRVACGHNRGGPCWNCRSAAPRWLPGTCIRTLAHGNRIVNGYSGYGSALQDFVGGPPFTEIARIDDALAMARALGLRWIIVHPPLYKDPASGAAILEAVRGATTHVARVVPFEAAAVAELRPTASRTSLPVDPAWRGAAAHVHALGIQLL